MLQKNKNSINAKVYTRLSILTQEFNTDMFLLFCTHTVTTLRLCLFICFFKPCNFLQFVNNKVKVCFSCFTCRVTMYVCMYMYWDCTKIHNTVFQITFKVRESMKNFEGSKVWFSLPIFLSSPFTLSSQEASFVWFLT